MKTKNYLALVLSCGLILSGTSYAYASDVDTDIENPTEVTEPVVVPEANSEIVETIDENLEETTNLEASEDSESTENEEATDDTVTTGDQPVEEENQDPPPDDIQEQVRQKREELKQAIEIAKELKNDDLYKNESDEVRNNYDEAILKAEEVYENEDANLDDLQNAIDLLNYVKSQLGPKVQPYAAEEEPEKEITSQRVLSYSYPSSYFYDYWYDGLSYKYYPYSDYYYDYYPSYYYRYYPYSRYYYDYDYDYDYDYYYYPSSYYKYYTIDGLTYKYYPYSSYYYSRYYPYSYKYLYYPVTIDYASLTSPITESEDIIVGSSFTTIEAGTYKRSELKEKREQLQKSINKNKESVKAANLLTRTMPNFANTNKEKLAKLISDSKTAQYKAQAAVNELDEILK